MNRLNFSRNYLFVIARGRQNDGIARRLRRSGSP